MTRSTRARAAWTSALVLLAAGCAAGTTTFPLRAITWVDDDRQPFAPAPDERFVPVYWDAADHLIFRRASEMWALELASESIDVNALDEVPDSTFFVNRIGRAAMTPAEVARGACPDDVDPPAPWTVVGGKPDGASPGFFVRAADGTRYLFKIDRPGQPEQSSAADAIAAAVFHAAGYWVPCNRVALFDERGTLVLDPDARTSSASGRRPITQDDVDAVVRAAPRAPDGRRRAMLSRFVEGTPVGPWDFVGTWDADPNDVVPHERRRELRGIYVLDAWLDHWDARQANTLATWIATDGEAGYVRHYLLDFGDSLGMTRGNHRAAPRLGHTTYFDPVDIVVDTLAFGIPTRPWDGRQPAPMLAYFDHEHFDPDDWHPHYWNGALDRRTERDVAWGARILARFDDAHVRALVALGHYSDPAIAARMEEVLRGRRDRLLARYLGRLSPLADPEIVRTDDDRAMICLTDLAVLRGVRASRRYRARWRGEDVRVAAHGARVCAPLPPVDGLGRADDYGVLDVAAAPGEAPIGALRVHAYVTGRDRLTLVGLERPSP